MPKHKKHKISPEGRKAMSEGGKRGGPISPTNFKNNPDLAKKAGSLGGYAKSKKAVDKSS